jgi:hypothetical protein
MLDPFSDLVMEINTDQHRWKIIDGHPATSRRAPGN